MALVFPRDLPEVNGYLPFRTVEFDPLYNIATAPTRGGEIQAVSLGPDLWQMMFTSMAMEHQQAAELLAWLHTLRGGRRFFKAWHSLRKFPYAYRETGWTGLTVGGDPFEGTCTLASIAGSRDSVGLSGLPANFIFSVGDFISFPASFNGSQALHRVVAPVTANGSGAVSELIVEPSIIPGAEDDVEVTLEKPWCLAQVDPASIRGPLEASQAATVSFRATQTYAPA